MEPSAPQERFTLIEGQGVDFRAAFARDVREGLQSSPKRLSCCYFYDREGALLFDAICKLPEYYLTRAEHEILSARAPEIVAGLATPVTLVELGSGTAAKTRLLIEAILRRQDSLRYVPIDICRPALEDSARHLLRDYPALEMLAIAAEYHEALPHLQKIEGPKLILWLGSNLGNFHREDAARFLGQVRETMASADSLLVGIDLRKNRAVLERAYDDSQGVTAAFNLNLLARINRELGGHFEVACFKHRAVYNEEAGRIEMYLVSRNQQRVGVDDLGLDVGLAKEEAIHTENSYKFSIVEIDALSAAAELCVQCQWHDMEGRFSLSVLKPSSSPLRPAPRRMS